MAWLKNNWFKLLAAIILLISLGDWPYGYYQMLRWVVCAVAAYVAYLSYQEKKIGWAWIFGTMAILFNPIYPFEFQRGAWQVIDIISAGIFLASALAELRKIIWHFIRTHKRQISIILLVLIVIGGMAYLQRVQAQREFHEKEVAYQNCLDKVAANRKVVQSEEDEYRRKYKSPSNNFNPVRFGGRLSAYFEDNRVVDPNYETNYEAIASKNFFYQWAQAGRPHYNQGRGYWEAGFMRWMIDNHPEFCEEFNPIKINEFLEFKLAEVQA